MKFYQIKNPLVRVPTMLMVTIFILLVWTPIFSVYAISKGLKSCVRTIAWEYKNDAVFSQFYWREWVRSIVGKNIEEE